MIRGKNIACDRPIVRGILTTLLAKKIKEYVKNDQFVEARMQLAFTPTLLKGLPQMDEGECNFKLPQILSDEDPIEENDDDVVGALKRRLFWSMRPRKTSSSLICSVLKQSEDDDMIDFESGYTLVRFFEPVIFVFAEFIHTHKQTAHVCCTNGRSWSSRTNT